MELCVIGYNVQHYKTCKRKHDGTNKALQLLDNNTSRLIIKTVIIVLLSAKALATGDIFDIIETW